MTTSWIHNLVMFGAYCMRSGSFGLYALIIQRLEGSAAAFRIVESAALTNPCKNK
jgi:hypothetical protein